MTTVLVLGSSGVIGQHMRLCRPDGHLIYWHRSEQDDLHDVACDLNDRDATRAMLVEVQPDVIVNLAGQSNVDTVERDPGAYRWINAEFPAWLYGWCQKNGAWLVTCSSNAALDPVNAYGQQKAHVEQRLAEYCTVARPTFVLGVAPFPGLCRRNPIESLAKTEMEVCDRWFSPGIAADIAESMWRLVEERPVGVVNLGVPEKMTRYHLAGAVRGWWEMPEAVPYDRFPGAARSYDLSYLEAMTTVDNLWDQLRNQLPYQLYQRGAMTIEQRAREIAIFLGLTEGEALTRLWRGFTELHNAVAEDFRAAKIGGDDSRLLEWYRQTDAYIWELSVYHADAGFNYRGMADGVIARLKSEGVTGKVLVLGDGIGDFTLWSRQAGIDAVYHDLAGSKTALFASARYQGYMGEKMPMQCSIAWDPQFPAVEYDAVVSLDFMEHVTDVPAWVAAIRHTLKPGGLLVAQNAFGLGSGESGGMPMHLARNDKYEREWDPLLFGMGFTQLSSNWYRSAIEAVAA